MNKEYILCAAIYYDNGIKYDHQPINITDGLIVCGRRHHNCFTTVKYLGPLYKNIKTEQGFITNKDRFLNREEAYKLAVDAGQIKDEKKIKRLYSEDLY